MQTGGVPAAAALAVTGLVVGFQNAPASASTPTREGAPAAPKTEPVHGVTTMRFHPAKQLAALDVHPRVAMRILRQSKINLTMEIYTETTSEATRDALRKLGDWLA
jgi:hypothetical protein